MKYPWYKAFLLSSCLIAADCIFAAEDLGWRDSLHSDSTRRTPIHASASKTSQNFPPDGAAPNPVLRQKSVSQLRLHSPPSREGGSRVTAYSPRPAPTPPSRAGYTAWWEDLLPRQQSPLPQDSRSRDPARPATGRALRGSTLIDPRLRRSVLNLAPKTVQQPLPTQTTTRQIPKTGGNVRPVPLFVGAFGETVRRQETEVRASRALRLAEAPSRMLDPIGVPNTIPGVVFSTVNSQQHLVLNLNINNRTVSHTVDLIHFAENGQLQRFVSEDYITTLTPQDAGAIQIHVSKQGRRVAVGTFKIDANKHTLLIESLVTEDSFHINFAGKIVINRLESVPTAHASSHLFITSRRDIVLGSDVNVNLDQLTVNAKTFVQKGELRIHKFSCSAEELINDGTMEIQECVILSLLKKLTNNASLRFSQPRLSINVPEFVNGGIFLANDISIISTRGRNSRLIKATTIYLKCEEVFSNTGGEHDGLILVDKNQPEGLWGIHGVTIRLALKTLENDPQGLIWASKGIEGTFAECLRTKDTFVV